jgi:hypothetical protein
MAARDLAVIDADIGVSRTTYQQSLAEIETIRCEKIVARDPERKVTRLDTGGEANRLDCLLIPIIGDCLYLTRRHLFFTLIGRERQPSTLLRDRGNFFEGGTRVKASGCTSLTTTQQDGCIAV